MWTTCPPTRSRSSPGCDPLTILITKWFGVFLCDEKSGRIIDKRLMPHDAAIVSEKLASVQRGALLDEERDAGKSARKKVRAPHERIDVEREGDSPDKDEHEPLRLVPQF